jgi:hypothetical protein
LYWSTLRLATLTEDFWPHRLRGFAENAEGAEKGGASSGYRDGSLIRINRIFLIQRIDHLGASVHRARAPFFLLFALRRLCDGPKPARAAVNKKSRAAKMGCNAATIDQLDPNNLP